MIIISQTVTKFIRFLLLSSLLTLLLFILTETTYISDILEHHIIHVSTESTIPVTKPPESLIVLHSSPTFHGTAMSIPLQIIRQMQTVGSWQPNCPVSLQDLVYLQLDHWGFDNKIHQGELIVHKSLAQKVLDIFEQLYHIEFPIEKMRLIEEYNANDELSMSDNNSSAFNCREITQKPGYFSQHSYGYAIDINPIFNPYVTVSIDYLLKQGWDEKDDNIDFIERLGYTTEVPVNSFCQAQPLNCIILPKISTAFIDRTQVITGLIQANDPIVKIFRQHGFIWGGNWRNTLDYQHFEYQNSME